MLMRVQGIVLSHPPVTCGLGFLGDHPLGVRLGPMGLLLPGYVDDPLVMMMVLGVTCGSRRRRWRGRGRGTRCG